MSLASDDIDSSTPERHGPALDLGFVRAANLSKSSRGPWSRAQTQLAVQHRYQQAQRKIDLSNALLFALLGSTSKLLGQSFPSFAAARIVPADQRYVGLGDCVVGARASSFCFGDEGYRLSHGVR